MREPVQLLLPLILRDLERDDIDEAPVHRWLRAGDQAPPVTRAPASVWDLATRPAPRLRLATATAPAVTRVTREGGTVRLERILPQETDEWQQREQARRARQRPPRPSRRTRSRKLLEMIGEGGKE